MNDFYTFIIGSTINTNHGVFPREIRFKQTLDTIESIRNKVKNSKILLIDNSLEELYDYQKELLSNKVDVFKYIEPSLVGEYFNNINSKGAGELCLLYEALKLIEKHNLIGKRIFKLSGRYKLADSFDIIDYESDNVFGKYICRINDWDITSNFGIERVTYFETRFWSFCSSLFDEFKVMLPEIFMYMMHVDHNLEKSFYKCIPPDKRLEYNPIHVEGWTADTGLYKFE